MSLATRSMFPFRRVCNPYGTGKAAVGFEPTHFGLQSRCSTTELDRRKAMNEMASMVCYSPHCLARVLVCKAIDCPKGELTMPLFHSTFPRHFVEMVQLRGIHRIAGSIVIIRRFQLVFNTRCATRKVLLCIRCMARRPCPA